MKSWSLVKRWVFYQGVTTFIVLILSVFFVEDLVHLGVGVGIKESVQILKPQFASLNPEELKQYFLKTQPPFVGLYDQNGHVIYRPDDDLPQDLSHVKSSYKLYDKTFLIYVERLPNNFYLLGFTRKERMVYIENYITKTIIILISALFLGSSSVAYFILKRLYNPVEKLSLQMETAFDLLEPLTMSASETQDPKIAQLITVFNQLISTTKEQFSKLKKKAKQQKLILDTLEEGICLFTHEQKNIYANSQAHFYLKAKNDQDLLSHSTVGETIHQLLTPEIQKPLKEKCLDQNRYYELTVKHILDNQQLVVIYDETDRIEKLESGKTFISNASHELRTPITIIKGFAEALTDKEALKHISLDEILPKILAACDRMDALIKRLLLLADIDQRHLELTSFDLAHLIQQEITLFKTLDPKALIAYEGPDEAPFKGDEDLLKIVFSNLISNGLKYSHEPKQITVTLCSTPEYFELRFKDQGIGIPKSDLDKVFERFYRVDKARSRKMGGAGLGLSLVKTIIDKHRATIFVDSILGAGSTFVVRLPRL
jgi:signal transduction histidine kinase